MRARGNDLPSLSSAGIYGQQSRVSSVLSLSSDEFSIVPGDDLADRPTSELNTYVMLALLVFLGVFSLLGVGIIGFAVFLLVTGAIDLFPEAYLDNIGALVGAAALSLSVACLGCAGAVRQTQRYGCFQGRRVLILFWLCMTAFLVGTAVVIIRLHVLDESMDFTLRNLATTDFDTFERIVARDFNQQYFDASCSIGETGYLWGLVSRQCPDFMSQDRCSAVSRECATCIEGRCGTYSTDTIFASIDVEVCPSIERCSDSIDPELTGCPYVACRRGLLEFFIDTMQPVLALLIFYAAMTMVILVLTCCAICYNPRLSIEQKLIKTGVARIARKQAGTPKRAG